jgi:hypothetical protein
MRPDRAVDQAHGQDLFGRRTTFALEEAARDLAGSLGLLAVVDGQREEVLVLARRRCRADRGEALRATERGDHAAVGLPRDLTRLQGQRQPGDLAFDASVLATHESRFLLSSVYLTRFQLCRVLVRAAAARGRGWLRPRKVRTRQLPFGRLSRACGG